MSFLQVRFSGRYKAQAMVKKTKAKNIYRGRNIQTGELVIVKAEFFKGKSSNILFQGKFLQMTQGCPGIPWMHWCGPQSQECNCLIVEHLGYRLDELFQMCDRRFSIKTVTMIALQTLEMLQVYHFKELVHRNVCPRSFQLGMGRKNHQFFFNDLLGSKKYIDTKTNQHIMKREGMEPEISNLFNSYNVLRGEDPSRRDDLESWLLMLIYFLKGTLPWIHISQQDQELSIKVYEIRKHISKAQLFKGTPIEFQQMWDHIISLKYEDKPDYHYLRKRLLRLQTRKNIDNDYLYDWILKGIADHEKLDCVNLQESPVNCQIIPNQETFLKLFYQPYEKDLELNEIQKKFKSKRHIELEESMVGNRKDDGHSAAQSTRSTSKEQCCTF